MVVIDKITATQIESMTHIPDTRYQPRNPKNHTTHTKNTEEDRITEYNKLITIKIIKTRIIFIT